MKNYEQSVTELRAYKSHVIALQEDLEEVEKENNTLRMITEKSEQGRRMSILITENEALFQSNRTLCDQLEDLETEVEEKEYEAGVTLDIEKTRLRRQSEAFIEQNTILEQELQELKEEDAAKLKEVSNLRMQKDSLDAKISELNNIVTATEEKNALLEKERRELKKISLELKMANTSLELKMKNLVNQSPELASKIFKEEVALAESGNGEARIERLQDDNDIETRKIEEINATTSLNLLNKDQLKPIDKSPKHENGLLNNRRNSNGFHSDEENVEI